MTDPCHYCDRRAYVRLLIRTPDGDRVEPRCDLHASAGADGRLPAHARRVARLARVERERRQEVLQ